MEVALKQYQHNRVETWMSSLAEHQSNQMQRFSYEIKQLETLLRITTNTGASQQVQQDLEEKQAEWAACYKGFEESVLQLRERLRVLRLLEWAALKRHNLEHVSTHPSDSNSATPLPTNVSTKSVLQWWLD